MAETQSAEVNLEELLNRVRTQPLQEQVDNIRFRPLAAKAEKRKAKIDKQKKKAAKLTDKINKGNQKINKWKAKIADAQKTKAYCKQLLATHSLPKPLQMFFQGLMDKQDKKIERCQGKISQKEQKIKKLKGKRSKQEKKIQKQQAKIDKIAGIDRFITNMGTAQGRRENFLQVLTSMRKSSLEQKKEKLAAVQKKIAKKESALSKATSETEKVKLQQQIDKLKDQKDKLEGKINRLEAMAEKLDAFAAMTAQDLEKLITATTEGAKATFEYDDYDLDDVFVVEADKAFGNQQIEHELSDEDKVVIAQLENEVLVDRLYYGEVSKETMQHIQQAGFEFDGYKFTKAEPTQEEMQEDFEMYFEPDEPDEPEQQAEQEPEQQAEQEPEQQTEQEPEQQTEQEPDLPDEQESEQQAEQEPDLPDEQEQEQQAKPEQEQQAKPEPEQQAKPEPEQQTEPKPEHQAKQNQPQHGTAQKATQGNGQTAGARKQSDLVKFSGLSATHIQALKDSNITFWVKKESENTFSAFVHRSDAEQAKGILSSVSQAQKKTASPVRQTHRKM